MIYNREINCLRAYCRHEAQRYAEAADTVRAWVALELGDKLSMLTDRPFASPDAFRAAITDMIPVHESYALTHLRNKTEEFKLRRVAQAFAEQLDAVLSGRCDYEPLPYRRLITGTEAECILARYRVFADGKLCSSETVPPTAGSRPSLFLMTHYVLPYMEGLASIMGLPAQPVYKKADPFRVDRVELTAALTLSGMEPTFFDRAVTWTVCFTHEGTVEFDGVIVDDVKKLLANEQAHFDRYEG